MWGQRGCPSSQHTAPASSAVKDSTTAKKMSPWQRYGRTGLFFPPWGRGEGLETLAAQPRHVLGSGSWAGTHGLSPRPPPKEALARGLPLHCPQAARQPEEL